MADRWLEHTVAEEEAGRTVQEVLTGPMHGPTWWPLIPAIFVTPFATFALNRQWVFS